MGMCLTTRSFILIYSGRISMRDLLVDQVQKFYINTLSNPKFEFCKRIYVLVNVSFYIILLILNFKKLSM